VSSPHSSQTVGVAHVAVSGALAYDQICRTDTSLAAGSEPLLNRKLTDMQQAYGGCGGNLAYNFARLQQPAMLLSCSGMLDDGDYMQHLEALGVDTRHCLRTPDQYSARAVIFTDRDGKQFTGFYPGPVPEAERWQQHLRSIDFSATAVFVQAPYPAALMQAGLAHMRQLDDVPLLVFVPGQYADQLSAEDIAAMVEMADWIIGNEHEINALQAHHELHQQLVICTHGAQPISLRCPDGRQADIPVPAVDHNVDPTGCGDALVAGLCHHLVAHATRHRVDLRALAGSGRRQDVELLTAALLSGCRLAAACLGHPGGQHHRAPLI